MAILQKFQKPTCLSVWLLSSCVTGPGSQSSKNGDYELSRKNREPQLFMMNAGAASEKNERKHWLDVRRGAETDGLQKIEAALLAGEALTAEQESQAFLNKNPKNLGALKILITSLAMQGKLDRAEALLTLTETWHGPQAELANIRGLHQLMKIGRNDSHLLSALDVFRNAFDLDSTEVAAGINLGNL